MQEAKTIRVIEVRAAENGYVITAMEREGRVMNDYAPVVYKSFVAANPRAAGDLIERLCKTEKIEKHVEIPPARRL